MMWELLNYDWQRKRGQVRRRKEHSKKIQNNLLSSTGFLLYPNQRHGESRDGPKTGERDRGAVVDPHPTALRRCGLAGYGVARTWGWSEAPMHALFVCLIAPTTIEHSSSRAAAGTNPSATRLPHRTQIRNLTTAPLSVAVYACLC